MFIVAGSPGRWWVGWQYPSWKENARPLWAPGPSGKRAMASRWPGDMAGPEDTQRPMAGSMCPVMETTQRGQIHCQQRIKNTMAFLWTPAGFPSAIHSGELPSPLSRIHWDTERVGT